MAVAVAVAVGAGWLASAPAEAAAPAPLVLVAPAESAQEAEPQAVAEAVSQALTDLPGEPLAVKPDESSAPRAQAPAAAVDGVARLDAAAAGQVEVALDQPDGAVAVLVTDALATDEFSVAGVTWQGDGEPGRVLARAYQDDEWTEWFELHQADGPDPDSAEGRRAKAGTDPLVVAGATAIQVQVLSQPGGALPEDVAPAVVPLTAQEADPSPDDAGAVDPAVAGSAGASAPGTTTAAAWPGTAGNPAALGAAAAASAAKPTINPRSAWNAAAANYSGNTPKGEPVVAAKLHGAIVHHQEGTNNYSQAQVPGIIRSIQSWHMGNNGWDDIGYNFLIDKYGGVWEGRQGGVERNVVGAHAYEFNTGTTGVCFLGSMETAEPTAVALDAAGRLVAWRLGLAGITNLKGSTVYPADPRQQSKPIVAGHRDVNATTCPGRYLYAKLDVIRSYQPAVVANYSQVVISPDMNGDGRGEILAVDTKGRLFAFPVGQGGSLGEPRQIGSGWSTFTLMAPGDWNGDGTVDLMAISPKGDLQYYPGRDGDFAAPVRIGYGWIGYTAKSSRDVDGDGHPDLLAVKNSTGQLLLYRGDGRGGFVTGRGEVVGSGWKTFQFAAAGDVNGDGLADIFGVDPAGKLYSYPAVRGGGFGARVVSGAGWLEWELIAGGDLSGDGRADIGGIHGSSRIVNYYAGLGNGGFARSVQVAADW